MKTRRVFIRTTAALLTILLLCTQSTLAITQGDLRAIIRGTPFYDPSGGCGSGGVVNGGVGSANIYVLGDSLTEGMQGEGGLSNKLFTAGWKGVTVNGECGRSLASDRTGPCPENRGKVVVNGISVIDQPEDNAAVAAAGLVVVGLGTNDFGDTQYETHARELITKIKTINPSTKIYWTNLYSTAPEATAYPAMNTILSKLAGEQLINKVIDWATEGRGYYQPGNIHPSGHYKEMATYISQEASNGLVSNTVTPGTGTNTKLPAEWVPILGRAGQRFSIDPAILGGILKVETNWVLPAAFATNPYRNSATATGPFQIIDSTAPSLMPAPDKWTTITDTAKYTSNTVKAASGGAITETDGKYIVDGNKDGSVDRATPEDAALMAAALLKTLGAGPTTALGDPGDYAVAANNSDGKITVRTVAAHYNQGGGWSSDRAVQGNNNVQKYMDIVMETTAALRASGVFGGSYPPVTGGCANNGNGGDGAVAGNIVQTALNLVWTDPAKVASIKAAQKDLGCTMDAGAQACGQLRANAGVLIKKSDATDTFQVALPKYNPGNDTDAAAWAYSDCGAFVATVIRASGADPNYAARGTTIQLSYARAHPELYDVVQFTDTSVAQPGDWFISDAHTFIYVGSNSFGTSDAADASWGGHVPYLGGKLTPDPAYFRIRKK
jgi:lysophospholipase L1-like esterase